MARASEGGKEGELSRHLISTHFDQYMYSESSMRTGSFFAFLSLNECENEMK